MGNPDQRLKRGLLISSGVVLYTLSSFPQTSVFGTLVFPLMPRVKGISDHLFPLQQMFSHELPCVDCYCVILDSCRCRTVHTRSLTGCSCLLELRWLADSQGPAFLCLPKLGSAGSGSVPSLLRGLCIYSILLSPKVPCPFIGILLLLLLLRQGFTKFPQAGSGLTLYRE